MNASAKKWLLFSITLMLMAGTAGALTWLKSNQKLGAPGVVATVIPDRVAMRLELPEHVLEFSSTNVPEPELVLSYLPKDTSYTGRCYFTTNGIWVNATLILMGADRTSIHKPDYCLDGQGWQIREKTEVKLPITGARPYELPVMKWVMGKTVTTPDGHQQPVSGLYVFWFVTENQTSDSFQGMLNSMLYHLVRHGVLQRWAYVSYFAYCLPGQEDATFVRMKELITASVPAYQLPPADAK